MIGESLSDRTSGERVALCLYGKFNNRYSEKSGEEGYEYIKSQILDRSDCDFDIFIYSTDIENKQRILSLYEKDIVTAKIEAPVNFQKIIAENQIDESVFSPIDGFRTVANTLSFLYSRKKV